MRLAALSLLVLLACVGSVMAVCDNEPCNTGRSYYNWDAWRTHGDKFPSFRPNHNTLAEESYFKSQVSLDTTGIDRSGSSEGSKSAKTLFVEDMDNDGHNDIVIGVYKSCYIYWNEGGGTFGAPQQILIASATVADSGVGCWIIDVDNNGVKDLLIGGSNNRGFVQNNGGRTFTEKTPFQNHYNAKINDVFVVDLNDDGYDDFLYADGWGFSMMNPQGTSWDLNAFGRDSYAWDGNAANAYRYVGYIKDFQYGKMPLVTARGADTATVNSNWWKKNRFDVGRYTSCPADGMSPCTDTSGGHISHYWARPMGLQETLGGDFNNDGYADIAVIAQMMPLGVTYRKPGTGLYTIQLIDIETVAEQYGFEQYGIESGDFNADGWLDLLWFSKHDTTDVRAFVNLGAQGLITEQAKGNNPTYLDVNAWSEHRTTIAGGINMCPSGSCNWKYGEVGVNTGDLDGDGMPDLVHAGYGQVVWLKNSQLPSVVMGINDNGDTVKCTDGACEVFDAASGRFVADDSISESDLHNTSPSASASEWTAVPGTQTYSLTVNVDYATLDEAFEETAQNYLQGILDDLLATDGTGLSATIVIDSIHAGSTIVDFSTDGDALPQPVSDGLTDFASHANSGSFLGGNVIDASSSSEQFKIDADGNFQMRAADGTITTTKTSC